MDIATCTGLAVGSHDGQPRAWSADLQGWTADSSYAHIIARTSKLIEVNKPDLAIVETPVGGNKRNEKLTGLEACARGVLALRRIPTKRTSVQAVRKHFLGRAFTYKDFPGLTQKGARERIKSMVMARCRDLGWQVDNDDEADALALWDFACAQWAPKYQSPTGGLFGNNRGQG